jgi:hypothetical protein
VRRKLSSLCACCAPRARAWVAVSVSICLSACRVVVRRRGSGRRRRRRRRRPWSSMAACRRRATGLQRLVGKRLCESGQSQRVMVCLREGGPEMRIGSRQALCRCRRRSSSSAGGLRAVAELVLRVGWKLAPAIGWCCCLWLCFDLLLPQFGSPVRPLVCRNVMFRYVLRVPSGQTLLSDWGGGADGRGSTSKQNGGVGEMR